MKKLEDVEAAEREKAFFECDVSDPDAEVTWERDGKVLIDFSLSVKAVTLILISGRGSAISSAKQGKSGSIYNFVKK